MSKTLNLKRILKLVFILVVILIFTGCGLPNIEKLKANHDVKGLIKLLAYEGPEEMTVVSEAWKALVEMDNEAVEPLIEALNHKNTRIAAYATELLGEIGDTRAVEPLIAALDKEGMYSGAAYALAQIGDIRATGPLLEKLNYYRDLGRESEAAVDALTMINIKYILPVCGGQGVSTKSYQPDEPGPHPIIIADENFNLYSTLYHNYNWNNLIPVEWRSLGSPEKIELVLCYEIVDVVVEECRYGTGDNRVTITRIRQDWNVELREAATGETIVADVIEGDDPSECPWLIQEDDPDSEITGKVSEKILTDWLREFVE